MIKVKNQRIWNLAAGVDATWMDFDALTSGYGAAHCTTQVLLRDGTTVDTEPSQITDRNR